MASFPIKAVIGITFPFPGAFIGSYITRKNIKSWYDLKLRKPSWRPPNWLFGPVWTALYGSMGYASYLVWRDGGGFQGDAKLPLILYSIQLGLNWAYTPIFFGLKKLKWALIDIVALDVGIIATAGAFSRVNSTAAYLMLPYFAWCAFATLLTQWIYCNNKEKKAE